MMPLKTILVHVESTAPARARIAFDLARRHQARLIGVAAEMWSVPTVYTSPETIPLTPVLIEEARERVATRLRAAADLFQELADEYRVKTSWRSHEDCPQGPMSSAAVAADLVIAGSADAISEERLPALDPGHLLMAAGRPLLLIPANAEQLYASHITVAWKDTREARRAVADALPLLAAAPVTTILQIREPGMETRSIEDVHDFLAAHGVNAIMCIVDAGVETEVDLVRRAIEGGSDLIVAGGYGRSKLLEWAFGGVTRGLLKQQRIACLLSH